MWQLVALWIASFAVVSLLMRPKTAQQQGPTPSTDVDAPVAEEGKSIGVLFGTRDLTGPNCVWYGDLKTTAIRKKGGKK